MKIIGLFVKQALAEKLMRRGRGGRLSLPCLSYRPTQLSMRITTSSDIGGDSDRKRSRSFANTNNESS